MLLFVLHHDLRLPAAAEFPVAKFIVVCLAPSFPTRTASAVSISLPLFIFSSITYLPVFVAPLSSILIAFPQPFVFPFKFFTLLAFALPPTSWSASFALP